MKRKNLLLLLPFIFSFLVFNSHAQNMKSFVKAGDKAFAEGDFYEALINYKKAVDIDSSKLDIVYKLAEAARMNNDYKIAEHYYKFIFDKDKAQPLLFPQAQFWLASMKKSLGKYPEAKKLFKAYASKHKAVNDYHTQKAKYEMTALDATINQAKTVDPKINVLHMDTSVNGPYADISPYQLGDTIFYFSSIRTEFRIKDPKEKEETTVYLSKIYKTIRRQDSLWEDTKELTPMFNAPEVNNGNCVFSTDRKRFYFTRSKPSPNAEGLSEIWVSEFKGKWQPPVRLKDPVNLTGYTTTHPSIASNGKKGDLLYFSSDRPGGKGKFDIWVTSISPDGSKYSQPVNLGEKINSIDNEVTPFFDPKTQTLYFSSEWHKSLGGFDVFKAVKEGNSWGEVKNLGFPINSSYNDLYFFITESGKDGYFASNRPGTISNKGETCCNDIYYFEFTDIRKQLDSLKNLERLAIEAARELDRLTPINLYFDNDAPDPNRMDTVTALNYETTIRDYLSLRKDFETEYTKGLTGRQKEMASKEVADLFNNYVAPGMVKLEKFCDLIEKNLNNARNVKVKIKGFTSPLAMDDYNIALAKRRVKSVINYIREFNHSAFEKYLDGSAENGAALTIIEEAVGEAQAVKGISDNPNDEKGAVYSKAASLERRIQITDVIISEPVKKKPKS
jgi:tetratricopeptide (TPR) repeat protein